MRRSFRNNTSRLSFFAFQDIITGTAGFVIVITLFLALNLDEAIVSISTDADSPSKNQAELDGILAQVLEEKRKTALLQEPGDIQESEDTIRREINQLGALVADLSKTTASLELKSQQNGVSVSREQRIERERLITALATLADAQRRITLKLASGLGDMQRLEQEVRNAEEAVQRIRDRKNVLRLIPNKSNTSKQPVLVLVQDSRIAIQGFDGKNNQIIRSAEEFLPTLSALSAVDHYVVFYFKPSGASLFDQLVDETKRKGFEVGYDVVPEDIELEFSSDPKTTP
jgi:hypothetical protein